jgi:hypothetical protein
MKRRQLSLGFLTVSMALLGTRLAIAGVYNDAVLADDPVAYWRLGEADGNVALNSGLLGPAGVGAGRYTDHIQLGQPSLVLGAVWASTKSTALWRWIHYF